MTEFTRLVIEIIKSIPKGKVVTYGIVAFLAGNPKASRQVVRVLHAMSDLCNLPWHRVVNSKGMIGLKDTFSYNEQKQLLCEEGITFENEKIDFKKHLWNNNLRKSN